MKKAIVTYGLLVFVLVFSSATLSQIFLDGSADDWADVPYAVQDWVDGVEGLYPEEVGACVTDNVDIKNVKATIVGNTMYWFLQFHGGPAWPNDAKQTEVDGVPVTRTRGYYHTLVDLDNNIDTGWKTDWYEAHYTTVGYLASQGIEGAEPVGAELLMGWGGKYYYPAPHSDSGGIKNSGVQSLGYEMVDVSEYDGVSDNELMFGISGADIANPDSAKGMAFHGSYRVAESQNEALNSDSLRSFFLGHAWGDDFFEVGYEITPILEYFQAKGSTYFNEGDIIGICGFSETPADDWGVDITTRGEFTCPAIPARPSSMTFDRSDADWADVPFAVENWVDGVEGLYPEEVGACVTDNVDIKDVKAIVNLDEQSIYWFLRFQGGPAMPNDAKHTEVDGVPITRSRGYYHTLVDLDNNIETGWKTDWYEAHYTTVGYLASQGIEGAEPLGAEVLLGWGVKYYYPAPHSDSGGIKNSGVQSLGYEMVDVSEYDGVSDNELMFGIAGYEVTDPDSEKVLHLDGMWINQESQDPSLLNGSPEFLAHSWGFDFFEVRYPIATIKQYFMNKSGADYFKDGDVIGICGFSETPADDWGVDITTRGEITVGGGTGVADQVAVVKEYSLSENYPNPFNPTTAINYTAPVSGHVKLVVYNTLGRVVNTLVDNVVAAGKHTVTWDGTNSAGQQMATGVYFYTLETESFSQTKKMMLVK